MSKPRFVPRWALAAFVGVVPFGHMARAHADTPPSIWDMARDPGERERWELHERVPLFKCESNDDDDEDRRRQAELRCLDLLDKLDQADAAHSPDVRLRVDLGIAEYELAAITGRPELYAKAAAVLSEAIDMAPDDAATTEALGRLVYAYAKLDRPREELATWRRYIPKLIDPHARVVDMMNMGEAEMRLGQLDDALGTFREVMRECGELPNTSFTYVLTLWDLAVALDRSGDPRGALVTADKAAHETAVGGNGRVWLGRDLIVRNADVFFVPAWERQWYIALDAAAAGQAATDAHDDLAATAAWGAADRAWSTYLAQAERSGDKDRWAPIASVRRDHARRERAAAAARAAKHPGKLPAAPPSEP